jgi:hypothetical protein
MPEKRKRLTKATTYNPKAVELAYKMAFDDNNSFPRFIENLIYKEADKRGILV